MRKQNKKAPPQSLSQYFKIEEDKFEASGVFDRVLGIDSRFFIDPALFEETQIPEFINAREKLLKHFRTVIALLKSSTPFALNQARRLLTFKETKGVGIGYGEDTDNGNSVGPELAESLVQIGKELVDMGIDDPEIFELVGLFQDNFGPDRLSDITICILQQEFLKYTIRMTKELGIKKVREYPNKLKTESYILPYIEEIDKPTLFIPKEFLKDLPVAFDWDGVGYVAAFNEDLRRQYNDIFAEAYNQETGKRESDKKVRMKFIKTVRSEAVRSIVEIYKTAEKPLYDFETDPVGEIRWSTDAKLIAKEYPLRLHLANPNDVDEVYQVVVTMLKHFENLLSNTDVNRLLFSSKTGKPLPERYVQHLFQATSYSYCLMNNLDLTPESKGSSGPVDFKVSRGVIKIVVEIKKSTHKKLVHGISVQLPKYQKGENAQKAIFLVVRVTENMNQIDKLTEYIEFASTRSENLPECHIIDARIKPSPSKA